MSINSTGGHAIDNEVSGEWLQSRPGERFSIRISGLGNQWLLLRHGNPLKTW